MPPSRVIIDTDPGVDDMFALLLALASPEELTIEGLTIVFGNHNDLDILAENAVLALAIAGRADGSIPVFKGAREPSDGLGFHGHTGIVVHGDNGIGGVAPPPALMAAAARSMKVIEAEEADGNAAAMFMVETVLAHPGEITIVALGPLTNVAAAIALGGFRFVASLKRLVVMAGSVGAPPPSGMT